MAWGALRIGERAGRRGDTGWQAYLTQLFANLPDTPISRLDESLPDQWKKSHSPPAAKASPAES